MILRKMMLINLKKKKDLLLHLLKRIIVLEKLYQKFSKSLSIARVKHIIWNNQFFININAINLTKGMKFSFK